MLALSYILVEILQSLCSVILWWKSMHAAYLHDNIAGEVKENIKPHFILASIHKETAIVFPTSKQAEEKN